MRISVPSEGWVGGTPTPRNDSVASVMIAVARWIVAITSTGPSTLGSTCGEHDRERPAADDARRLHVLLVLLDQVEPRTVRAYCTQPAKPIASISTEIAISSCSSARQRDARHAVDQQRDQDRREGQLDVGDAHDEARRRAPPT